MLEVFYGSGNILKAFWEHLGAILTHYQAILGCLGQFGAILGYLGGRLGNILDNFGAISAPLGTILKPSWAGEAASMAWAKVCQTFRHQNI